MLLLEPGEERAEADGPADGVRAARAGDVDARDLGCLLLRLAGTVRDDGREHALGRGDVGAGRVLEDDAVPAAVARLEVLDGADAAERAARDDGERAAERLGLLHAVRREEQAAACALALRGDGGPERAPRDGVEARRRLVKDEQAGVLPVDFARNLNKLHISHRKPRHR